MSTINLIILFLLTAGIITVAIDLFFTRDKPSQANKFLCAALGTLIFISMCLAPPQRSGDGHEYFAMIESFFNHLTPDLRAQDVASLADLQKKFPVQDFFLNFWDLRWYKKAHDGSWHSVHFWAYPLINLPVKAALHELHLNEFKVMQITNALLLILGLLHILFIARLTELQKFIFILLIVFCPAFWFIRWTHPEIFSYVLVIMSLAYLSAGRFSLAIFSAAIAATQNQPLLLWTAFLWLQGMINSVQRRKDFFRFSILMLPAFSPMIFYHLHFGIFNLQHADLSMANASLLKVLDLFFDLSFGMLPYIPVALILFLGIVARDAFGYKKFSFNVQLFLLLFLMALGCTMKGDWHHGTSGPSRYIIWMLPFIFFVLISEPVLKLSPSDKSIYKIFIAVAIITQLYTVFISGGFIERENIQYLRHSPLAQFTLNHFPGLYNPNHQIFRERTAHTEDVSRDQPFIYYHGERCAKALARGRDKVKLEAQCGDIPAKYDRFFQAKDKKDVLQYINFY